jgi:PEGA domain
MLLAGRRARAGGDGDGARTFGLIDLSDPPAAAVIRARVEHEVAAKGLAPVADAATERALGAAEPPDALARRLVLEATRTRQKGDCPGALARAAQAEEAALSGLAIDEARLPARGALAVELACADQLGRADEARRAATRLRQLTSQPPDGVSQALWDRYAPARPATPVELSVDSEPPNARVAVNFHQAGVTPLTLEIPAGEVTVQIDKDGYQKVFRRLAAGPGPTRLSLALVERRRDRQGELARRVLALRGADPASHRPLMAQVSQLARVDVLVAFAARGTNVTVWWFDAESGDFVGPPAVMMIR